MPPRLSPATEVLGITPLAFQDYFKPGAPADSPIWSPEEQAVQREYAARQRATALEDRAIEQEDAAMQFNDEAPNMQLDELLGSMTPEMAARPGVNNYLNLRMRNEKPSRYSDSVLGPSLAAKIKNPHHAQQFKELLGQGIPAVDAYEQIKQREFNDDHEVELEKAGISPQERMELQVNGVYDPVRVAGAVERAKNDPKRERVVTPEMMAKYFDLTEMDPEKGRQYAQLSRDAGYLWPGFDKTQPKTAAVVEAAPAVAQPVAPAAAVPLRERIPAGVTPEEYVARRSIQEQEAQAEQTAAKAWTSAKGKLVEPFLKAYPTPELQLIAARAILDELPSEDPESPSYFDDNRGAVGKVPYEVLAMRKLGLDPTGKAFDEPGNLRLGSQEVDNRELLKAFAEDVIRVHEEQEKGAAPAAVPTGELPRPKSPAEAAQLPKGSRFIGPDGKIRVVP